MGSVYMRRKGNGKASLRKYYICDWFLFLLIVIKGIQYVQSCREGFKNKAWTVILLELSRVHYSFKLLDIVTEVGPSGIVISAPSC